MKNFKSNKVCYYDIQAPAEALTDDFLYLTFIAMNNVEAFVTITPSMDSEDIIYCQVSAGDTLLAKHPNKFFISFRSTVSDDSRFYLNTWFDGNKTMLPYANIERCTDKGASITG